MLTSVLGQGVRVQWAGHETFPLRLLWPKKAYEAVRGGASIKTFSEPAAIARFGVGRNMAISMRYWNLACGFIAEQGGLLVPTTLAKAILDDAGYDPCLEHPATAWLAHWHVASTPEMTTTAFYAFNMMSGADFDADALCAEILGLTTERGWRATRGTIRRDVDVFLRSYARRPDADAEDAAEPLLAELGLVSEARFGSSYDFARGPKPSLPDSVFAMALESFWQRRGSAATALSLEQVAYEPGSPGRVFKLDEDSVATRLMAIDAVTDGAWQWSDNAGLRQAQRLRALDPEALLAAAYSFRAGEAL